MAITLDPFQLIRRVNFPAGVLAENVGQVTQADTFIASTTELGPCESAGDDDPDFGPGSCDDSITLNNYYFTSFTIQLRSNILFCDQLKLTITGRTSGASVTYDWPAWLAANNIGSCLDVCDQLNDQCYYLGADSSRNELCQLEGTANAWSAAQQRHQIFTGSYTTTASMGFTLGENIDVKLGTFSVPIIKVVNDTGAGIWLHQLTPGDTVGGWTTGAYIRVEGTTNYNGTWRINSVQLVSGDEYRLALAATYVVDEFAGTIKPSYDAT